MVFSQVFEEREHRCTGLPKEFHSDGGLTRAVLKLGELERDIVHHLRRITQVAASVLGPDAQKLESLGRPGRLIINPGQSFRQLGQAGTNGLHGCARNGRHRRKARQGRRTGTCLLGQSLQRGRGLKRVRHEVAKRSDRGTANHDGKRRLGNTGDLLERSLHLAGVLVEHPRTATKIGLKFRRLCGELDNKRANVSHFFSPGARTWP